MKLLGYLYGKRFDSKYPQPIGRRGDGERGRVQVDEQAAEGKDP